jgi:hypothetical protein
MGGMMGTGGMVGRKSAINNRKKAGNHVRIMDNSFTSGISSVKETPQLGIDKYGSNFATRKYSKLQVYDEKKEDDNI